MVSPVSRGVTVRRMLRKTELIAGPLLACFQIVLEDFFVFRDQGRVLVEVDAVRIAQAVLGHIMEGQGGSTRFLSHGEGIATGHPGESPGAGTKRQGQGVIHHGDVLFAFAEEEEVVADHGVGPCDTEEGGCEVFQADEVRAFSWALPRELHEQGDMEGGLGQVKPFLTFS